MDAPRQERAIGSQAAGIAPISVAPASSHVPSVLLPVLLGVQTGLVERATETALPCAVRATMGTSGKIPAVCSAVVVRRSGLGLPVLGSIRLSALPIKFRVHSLTSTLCLHCFVCLQVAVAVTAGAALLLALAGLGYVAFRWWRRQKGRGQAGHAGRCVVS